MTDPLVLVLRHEPPIVIGGLALHERAILLALRAGLSVSTWGASAPDPVSRQRLVSRRATFAVLSPDHGPLDDLELGRPIVVVGARALFTAALLEAFTDTAAADPASARVVLDGEAPALLYLPPVLVSRMTSCLSIESMFAWLSARELVRAWAAPEAFARVVHPQDADAIERAYIRHLNGKESYFTKKIRRFSVPLSSRLARHGVRPSTVTLGGLVLAMASAWCLAQGPYLWGVLGGVLYYASMVCDCSDGEVARLTLRDSPFGAWLETFVDYSTYIMLWWALVLSAGVRPDAQWLEAAARIAIAGSVIVIIVASYLRFRVARTDPGQFDEASSKAMASSTGLNRFARWGRQWIKRSTIAHLVVALAVVNQVPALLYLWAFGAGVAAVVILAVQPFVIQRVLVRSTRVKSA